MGMAILLRNKCPASFLGSPLKARTSSIPKNRISISTFSVSSLVKPPHSKCGTTGILYLYFTAAASAIVPDADGLLFSPEDHRVFL